MTTPESYNDSPTRADLDAVCIESLVSELQYARERCADVEEERDTFRELLQRTLDLLNVKTAEVRQQSERMKEQRQTIRELREIIGHISAQQAAA